LPSIPALLILAAVAVGRRAQQDQRPHWLAICAHSILLAALAGGACVAPRIMLKVQMNAPSLMIAAVAGTFVFLLSALTLLGSGWRMLRFATLGPVILIVGFLLRGMAPLIDATQSSRPIAQLLMEIHQPGELPLATFAVNRNMAFGLAFYLDRRVAPYEGLEVSPAIYELPAAVPLQEHILVAREDSLPKLAGLLKSRRMQLIGSDRAQRIAIFRVSAAE
jgi:hypothetical protein